MTTGLDCFVAFALLRAPRNDKDYPPPSPLHHNFIFEGEGDFIVCATKSCPGLGRVSLLRSYIAPLFPRFYRALKYLARLASSL